MSKKTSNSASVPPVDFERLIKEHQLNQAIEKVTHWFSKCPGPCFPHVYRGWDS